MGQDDQRVCPAFGGAHTHEREHSRDLPRGHPKRQRHHGSLGVLPTWVAVRQPRHAGGDRRCDGPARDAAEHGEITDYLEAIDKKVDDVLRAQKDAVLADMIGVD